MYQTLSFKANSWVPHYSWYRAGGRSGQGTGLPNDATGVFGRSIQELVPPESIFDTLRCVSQTLLSFNMKIYKENLKLDWVQDLSLCLF